VSVCWMCSIRDEFHRRILAIMNDPRKIQMHEMVDF
jgi:hypothetical protein